MFHSVRMPVQELLRDHSLAKNAFESERKLHYYAVGQRASIVSSSQSISFDEPSLFITMGQWDSTGSQSEGLLVDSQMKHHEKSSVLVEAIPGFYDYRMPKKNEILWHVNFADPELFAFAHTSLFAQDEMQVLEHPLLYNIGKFLRSSKNKTGISSKTVSQMGTRHELATPIAIKHVPRIFSANSAKIYGHQFERAPSAVLSESISIRPLHQAPETNLLCMAAVQPTSSNASYSRREIQDLLRTAVSAFCLAATLSRKKKAVITNSTNAQPIQLTIATGHWGCGAFGGNKLMMAIVQIVAARWAGVDRLLYYCGTTDTHLLDQATKHASAAFKFQPQGAPILLSSERERVEAYLYALRLTWGTGNGT